MRNLEDLWQAAFPIGTEWDNMDKIREIKWDFSNLENTFEEGGELHGKTVYLFGSTEPQLLEVNGEQKVTLIPIVVAVVSPIPPSDKIGIKSVQRGGDIIPMKEMKMAWIPYVPLENRKREVARLKTQIYTLGCTQRRTALKHLKIERVKQYDYCLPYLQPLKPDEDEEDTVVNIMYPLKPPVSSEAPKLQCARRTRTGNVFETSPETFRKRFQYVSFRETKNFAVSPYPFRHTRFGASLPIVCAFDWEMGNLEEFTNGLIAKEALSEDLKDAFKEYVKEQVRERKETQRQAKEARKKAIEDMDPATKAAFENMRVYKFYPVQTPDTPDISNEKVAYINRYYWKAHVVV